MKIFANLSIERLSVDLLDFEPDLVHREMASMLALEIFATTRTLSLGNTALKVYLDRLNQPDSSPWIQSLIESVQTGDISADFATFTLLRFGRYEMSRPTRHQWMQGFRRLSALPCEEALNEDASNRCSWKRSASEAAELYLKGLLAHKILTRNFLDAEGFKYTFVWDSGDRASDILMENEREIAKTFSDFHSLDSEIGLLLSSKKRSVAEISRVAGEKLKDKTPDQQLLAATLDYLTNWNYLALIAWKLQPGRKKPIRVAPAGLADWSIGFGSMELSPDRKCWRLQISQRLNAELGHKLSTPILVEVGVQLLAVPITVISGVVSGVVAGRATGLVAPRLGAYLGGRLGSTAGAMVAGGLTRLIGATSGALSFTAAQRLGLASITLGHHPLYDRKKSFLGNYGHELLFGVSGFLFLPYTSALTDQLIAKASAHPSAPHLDALGNLTGFAIRSASDTALFTSVGYGERMIQKLFIHDPNPVFRGWGDAAENVGRSASISMAFRLHAHMKTH